MEKLVKHGPNHTDWLSNLTQTAGIDFPSDGVGDAILEGVIRTVKITHCKKCP